MKTKQNLSSEGPRTKIDHPGFDPSPARVSGMCFRFLHGSKPTAAAACCECKAEDATEIDMARLLQNNKKVT